MATRAAAARALIPGERSSRRISSQPRKDYTFIHNFGIADIVSSESSTTPSPTKTSSRKRKQVADHQRDAGSDQPVKRARKSKSEGTATTPRKTATKSRRKSDPVTKNSSKPKSTPKSTGRGRTSRLSVNKDPDGPIRGNSTPRRGSHSNSKSVKSRTSTTQSKKATTSTAKERSSSEPASSKIVVAGLAGQQVPTPESLNNASPLDNEGTVQNDITSIASQDLLNGTRGTTPEQALTPYEPASPPVSTLTDLTSTAGDEELQLEGEDLPTNTVDQSASLPHGHLGLAATPIDTDNAEAVPLSPESSRALVVPEISQPQRRRSHRSVNPIQRFGKPIDTSTTVGDETDDEDGTDSAEGSDNESEEEEEEEVELSETDGDPSDDGFDNFATRSRRTPKCSAKGKMKDLTLLTDTAASPANARKRKRPAKEYSKHSKRRNSVRFDLDRPGLVKLRISSEKLAQFSPSKPAQSQRVTTKKRQKSVSTKKAPKTKRSSLPARSSGLLLPPKADQTHAPSVVGVEELDDSGLDPELVQISRTMMARQPLSSKPAPQGRPEVWADSRQALCETVPYFKMAQSGCQSNDRHVYAFLFDGSGHCREYIDSDVIVARAGGGMESDASGQMLQKKDHLWTESQVQALLNDIEHQNPLILIAGNRNEVAICKLPHRYCVLGWYKPVAVWSEKSMGKGNKTWTTIKYRFERLDCSTKPWYAPEQDILTTIERHSVGPLIRQTCQHCQQEFPLVYLNGWMCLNASCDQFWILPSGIEAPCGKLFYHPAFLLHRTKWANEEQPYSVRPPIPDVGNVVGDNLTHINTRGICCPDCGRCSSRRFFKGWQCDNPSCSYTNFPKHIRVKAPMLHNPWENAGDGPSLSRNKHEKSLGVQIAVSHMHGYKVYTYTFNGVKGKFVHAVANAKINRQEGGADDMFAAMQQQDDPAMDLHLERRRFGIERHADPADVKRASIAPLPSPTERQAIAPRRATVAPIMTDSVRDLITQMHEYFRQIQWNDKDNADDVEMLRRDFFEATAELEESHASASQKLQGGEDGDFMTAFSMNYGMPYKFVASGASMPFVEAPWPVKACHADLNWASQRFLDPAGHDELNELLIFAYLEGQKIEYHDDGESGLGPRIATMSLGGKAKMHMRIKMKHHVGCSKSGIFNAERPIPGGLDGDEMYQKRLAAWNDLEALQHTDKRAYEARRKQIPKELGIYDKRTKLASDLVTVTLNHGDIVLMEGYEIQKYLEHKVVPESCLRFALTCRTVLPEHLKPEERPSYDVGPHDPSLSSLYRMEERERANAVSAEEGVSSGFA